MFLENLWECVIEHPIAVIVTVAILYLTHITLKPLNRIRRLGDVGLFFGKPELTGFYRERQLERLKLLRRTGDLPPVFPNGWYCVCESEKLQKNQIMEITILGQFLSLIRSESGTVYITDSYCPHIGANFNIGGRVVRDNCIQCPFHGWIFSAETGKCVEVPYDEGRIPEQAKVTTWPCIERNNNIYLWYHCDGVEPEWQIPEITEITEGLWKLGGRTEHELMCHIQEVPENGADIAHLNYLHKSAPEITNGSDIIKTDLSDPQPAVQHVWDGKWEVKSEEDKHCGVMHLNQFMTIWGYKVPLTSSKLVAEQVGHGPGIVHMLFDFGIWGKGVVFQTVTPEEPLLQRVRFRIFSNIPWFFVKFFMTVEAMQFERDVFIWSNKKYIKSPLLVKNDGPIQKHRRWFSQFYTENSPRMMKDGSLSNQAKSTFDW
ncbi:Protein CBR-DAF-36 [Caenorhabditis briggsae]|uniref:cholesterol 7-desaturase n=1 Tax=Caenorhabditis briggsae TaxID=6238 RepID=A8X8U1_CAEBR|nr:Protein CBR-DAF-36 [Caenorhabditis briggsae]CAP29052.2 Protein CBR-DAF-36 [Caenorhabditis briggsae]